MEMLPPAPSVVVGAAVEKRFPGYGTYRGTIAEINGGKVVVHWAATDERTSLTLNIQEDAAHAVNAAIRRAGLEGRRHMNPVVDGQLVPKPPRKPSSRKRRREDAPAAGVSASGSRQE